MKVNRTRHYATQNMQGNTGNRPEERLCFAIIKHHLIGLDYCEAQRITYIASGHCKLDVYFTTYSGQRYALRMMGEYHDPQKQEWFDHRQMLELLEKGYIVIDFSYTKMYYLFLRRERKLDWIELKAAYREIAAELRKFDLKLLKLKLKEINPQE